MNRCRRRMMEVLQERRLSLSRKKSRIGTISNGFHFLGIDYHGTQTRDNTNATHANDDAMRPPTPAQVLSDRGGGKTELHHKSHVPLRMIPHARTLRKAREQIKCMVLDGLSTQRIRNYLQLWCAWWARTSDTWQYQEIITRFIDACYDIRIAAYAEGLLQKLKASRTSALGDGLAGLLSAS